MQEYKSMTKSFLISKTANVPAAFVKSKLLLSIICDTGRSKKGLQYFVSSRWKKACSYLHVFNKMAMLLLISLEVSSGS
jgi:hypothetical protein